MDIFTFEISDKAKFVIWREDVEDIICFRYMSYVVLHFNDREVRIGKSIIAGFARVLKRKLELALENKLKLHTSIQKDIGYYWNQDLNEEESGKFLLKRADGYWIGNDYSLWTTDSARKYERFATWLHNDAQGNIVFTVTPTYPETFIDEEDPADVQAYQAWMENSYAPFFTCIISKATVFQWLDQAEQILQLIKDNEKILREIENDLHNA